MFNRNVFVNYFQSLSGFSLKFMIHLAEGKKVSLRCEGANSGHDLWYKMSNKGLAWSNGKIRTISYFTLPYQKNTEKFKYAYERVSKCLVSNVTGRVTGGPSFERDNLVNVIGLGYWIRTNARSAWIGTRHLILGNWRQLMLTPQIYRSSSVGIAGCSIWLETNVWWMNVALLVFLCEKDALKYKHIIGISVVTMTMTSQSKYIYSYAYST